METKKLSDLKALAKQMGVGGYSKMSKPELIKVLKQKEEPEICCEGAVCKLEPDSTQDEKNPEEIDSDAVLKKITKTKLIERAKQMGVSVKPKQEKREILNEIISKMTKNLLQELSC